MNKQIKILTNKLAKLNNDHKKQNADIQEGLQKEWNKVFEKDKVLQKALKNLEKSDKYGQDECGIYSWVRFEWSNYLKCADYLGQYLDDHHVRTDSLQDALILDMGPSLIVNDTGDVFDENSGTWIIQPNQYLRDVERNRQIEAWMERTGYFPGVFKLDYHGNVSLVNTQAKS